MQGMLVLQNVFSMCGKAGENGKIEAANRLKWCKQSRKNAEEYIKIILS